MPDKKLDAYVHEGATRKNLPTGKMAGEGVIPKVKKSKYHYSPHLSPELRFDPTGETDRLESIRQKVKGELTEEEQALLDAALDNNQPWLEWTEKKEQHDRELFEVDPVALHIHERISPQSIVRAMKREDLQQDLFDDPQLPYQKAIEFYKHDVGWANRMILGDSLQVMSSLSRREHLNGKVQMIYMDPPYGIKFSGNFQNEVGKRDMKENDKDMSREPEMVKAYRDTWNLGVHSYLTYLKERLIVARELLTESGSVFVQISDENLHRVCSVMDEVFGAENQIAIIPFRKKTMPFGSKFVEQMADFILWYGKRKFDENKRPITKYRPLPLPKNIEGEFHHCWYMFKNGGQERMSKAQVDNHSLLPDGVRVYRLKSLEPSGVMDSGKFDYEFNGRSFKHPTNGYATTPEGMKRLGRAGYLQPEGNRLTYILFPDGVSTLTVPWSDTVGADDKRYVVQTNTKVIQRCLLMTTDPGDLVFDPTGGSGTTAFVAEQWGRRWISMDSSRVAIAIARQRLMTAKFDYYRLNDEDSGVSSSFKYKSVPHITLKSIAQNTNLDPIFEKHESILEQRLQELNSALSVITEELIENLVSKLGEKLRTEKAKSITGADLRRWLLPNTDPDLITFGTAAQKKKWREAIPPEPEWREWEVPFDTDSDWPQEVQDAVSAYRAAWSEKMDEVNQCISDNAEQEELVDQPEVVRNVLRVSGPFTVEGVNPEELSMGDDGLFDPTPNEWEGEGVGPVSDESQNVHAYLDRMVQLMRQDGVTFPDNTRQTFRQIDPIFEDRTSNGLHAHGSWEEAAGDEENNVAVAFGPQYGPVTALQVEELIRSATMHDELVVAGFSFDAEASEMIEALQGQSQRLRVHMAHIRPDASPSMDGLLKDTPQNQMIFSVFGQPDVNVGDLGDGTFEVELVGVDIYNPLTGEVNSSGANKVAAWFLDGDYDGRCFCITQAFFPDKKAWEKIAKSLGDDANVEAIAALAGSKSLPIEPGEHNRIAVKVIDPRGNEVMTIRTLGE
jgi:adenine-specific DNA-methyltransferase